MSDISEAEEQEEFPPDETNVTVSSDIINARSFVAPVSRNTLLAVAVYLTVVGLSSTVGNSMFVVILRRRLRVICDGQNILLLNMAICDLGVSLTGYPYTTISAYVGRWVFGDTMCRMSAFFCFTLNEVQMNTLVIIAVFRYVTVCRPEFNYFLTNDLAKRCLLFVWIYSLSWTVPPLLGWSRYVHEPFEVSCSTDWHDRSPAGIAYSICLVVFCFLLQVSALAVCYSKILGTSRQLQLRPPETDPKWQEDQEYDTAPEMQCFKNYICVCESNLRNGVEKRVLLMNMLMVLSFVVCWTPYAVISIISVFNNDLQIFWYIFPTIFAKTSCMMNPIIYGFSHKLLRRDLFQLLRKCCCYSHADFIREQEESRKRIAEGTYDKEGIYVGKVKVGLCACNGCITGRRETLHAQMAVLARLKKCPVTNGLNGEAKDTEEVNTCAITLVDDNPTNNFQRDMQQTINIEGKQDKNNGDDIGMVEVIMSPKITQACNNIQNIHQKQQESSFADGQDSSPKDAKSEDTSSKKRKTTIKDETDENSLEISVTALIRKNTTTIISDSATTEEDVKRPMQGTVIEKTTTTATITNTTAHITV